VKERNKSSRSSSFDSIFRQVKPRKKFTLHWAFRLVGWGLCAFFIILSLFFLWAFAIQFGNDLTYQWLSSELIGFFAGMVCLEPIKVFNVHISLKLFSKMISLFFSILDFDHHNVSVVLLRDRGAGR
jgi:hypothetical protein